MQGQGRGRTKENGRNRAKGEVGKREWHWALVIAGHQLRITVYKGEKSAGDLRSGCWQILSSNLLPDLSLFSASLPFHWRTWIFNWNIHVDPDKSFALDSYQKKCTSVFVMEWFTQTSCLHLNLHWANNCSFQLFKRQKQEQIRKNSFHHASAVARQSEGEVHCWF